jgi:hypothetical protein
MYNQQLSYIVNSSPSVDPPISVNEDDPNFNSLSVQMSSISFQQPRQHVSISFFFVGSDERNSANVFR